MLLHLLLINCQQVVCISLQYFFAAFPGRNAYRFFVQFKGKKMGGGQERNIPEIRSHYSNRRKNNLDALRLSWRI